MGNVISNSDVSEADAGLSEHHPGCYPTSTVTRNKLTCIKKCNRGCYAGGGLTCKKHCWKHGSFLELQAATAEGTKSEYWPGSKPASKPAAVALPIQCCVKLDEDDNVIGGFVKSGPCMVKSVVIQMSKADCEARGKGSLLEMRARANVSEADSGLSEHHPGCYPTSTVTRNRLTCIKTCNRGCYPSGLTCKKHCFKHSSLLEMQAASVEEAKADFWPGSKAASKPTAV